MRFPRCFLFRMLSNLNPFFPPQIGRHKVELRDRQGRAVGQVELAVKAVNFGRPPSKYRAQGPAGEGSRHNWNHPLNKRNLNCMCLCYWGCTG